MRDLTHDHDEDPEEHKGRFLEPHEIIDPDYVDGLLASFEEDDNGIPGSHESSDASTD